MRFIEYLTLQGLGEGTKAQYVFFYKLFQKEHRIINQDTVNEFIIHHNYPLTRFFLQHLITYKGMKTIEIPKIRGRKRERLLKYLDSETIHVLADSYSTQDFYELRTKLMILLLFDGGLRISELLSLRPSRINLDEKSIIEGNSMRVIGKGDKERISYFTEKTKHYLRQYLNFIENDELLFPFTAQRAYQIITKAGLKISKKIHPHIFRHSCGTYMREKGFDLREIMDYLGHSRLETVRIYSHVDRSQMVDKLKKIRN